jgi:hypothetical protein
MIKACLFAVAVALGAASAVASCSAVPNDARIGIEAPVGPTGTFTVVGDYIELRCGSLDCHGQPGRNMRVWGQFGMRLRTGNTPGLAPPLSPMTTPDEYQATYRSVVGLEPTVMSSVVSNHGAHPEDLTFVRKARGLEAHKGGVLITPGDPQDVCITSWLASNVDVNACGLALTYPMFPMDASTE